ncbi:MAG: PQQ-binding-like beta-propeller repeat protein [Candidatus Bathyarchaeota archaeon]|nr:PQQ-binding-like beta-propeller repeat protein [Candidatus Termiticorpusculum sp.]MCL1970519.1 PQQ-binding-like beta-propeller repeat protein [Candidatus Termiticorpusculum sp.]
MLNQLARDGDGWNVTAVITDPDGHSETFTRMTWSTGTVGMSYVPNKEGDYKLQCRFERVYYTSGISTIPSGYYAASESEIVTLKVTGEWKPEHPGYAPPDQYWTRPIDAQLREWWSIAGSWVAKPNNAFAPYNDAPKSAHILWSMPIGDTMGGLSGGDNGMIAYQDGDAYEGKFTNNIIISGVLYYNRYVAASPTQTIVAVDLHTGKTLWERSYDFGGSRISTGQILTWLSLNNRGTWSYVWMTSGTNMFALDAKTGDLKYNMTNVPSGTIYYGPNGEMLKYQLVNYGTTDNPNYHLLQWNSSWVVNNGKSGVSDSWGSQVQGRTYNATERGYDLNVSIGAGTVITGSMVYAFPEDRIIYGRATTESITLSAISLKEGEKGRVIFKNETWVSPQDLESVDLYGQSTWSAISQEDMVITFWVKNSRINYAFSLETGKFMWKTDPQTYADAWVQATLGRSNIIVYHKLISVAAGGIVYCHDIKTGDLLWTYDVTDPYTESYLAPNWWVTPQFVSCGIAYFGHEEHSPLEPKPRGAPYFALNIETGEVVWRIDGAFRQTMWGGRSIIGDSIIITQNTYDQQIYAIGKGPSSMSVTAPDIAVTANTPVLIRGTIMDVSPGTESDDLRLRFPNGVPAVSDECMNEWMLFVYKQFPETHATGVPIRIDAIDPNGNYVTLGETVSDANGRFSFSFTPDKEGQYNIYAFFDGSASYYKTNAQTELLVMPGASASSTNYALYAFIVGIVLVIIAIVFGLLILKKK